MKTLLHPIFTLIGFSQVMRTAGGLCVLSFLIAGCGGQDKDNAEYGYITAPSIALRDRVAAVYNKVAFLNNGDRVRVLERSGNKRFVKVRTDDNKEGWIPQRYLVGQDVFDSYQRLAQQNAGNASQATAVTRRIVNMHVTPAREGETLYQLKEGERLELLKRTASPKVAPKPAPKVAEPAEEDKADKEKAKEDDDDEPAKPAAAPKSKVAAPAAPAVPMEDWWLVRDGRKRVGWILGRMMDVEIPLEVAQYAEGQRIVASYVLSEVPEHGESGDKLVPQYLVLLSENKDGLPFDFNQVRVFTWNTKRTRYETAYREHLQGELPFRAGKEDGNPFFVLRAKDPGGNVQERKYRMTGVMVKRVVEGTPVKFGSKVAPATSTSPKPGAKRP